LTGGAEGIRTPDLLIANETLYQLSYGPSQQPAGAKVTPSSSWLARQIGFHL
jgi:hypothetical protein